jgi:hypothetical protein
MFRIIILLDTLKTVCSELKIVNWWDWTQCHKRSYHCVWLLTAVISVHLCRWLHAQSKYFANLKLFVRMCHYSMKGFLSSITFLFSIFDIMSSLRRNYGKSINTGLSL